MPGWIPRVHKLELPQCRELQFSPLNFVSTGYPFDSQDASWDPETAIDATSKGERRVGRTGVVLVSMGAYLAILSLKCFIPTTVSKFYDANSPQARAALALLGKKKGIGGSDSKNPGGTTQPGVVADPDARNKALRDQKLKDDKTSSQTSTKNIFEVHESEAVDERDMPIFAT